MGKLFSAFIEQRDEIGSYSVLPVNYTSSSSKILLLDEKSIEDWNRFGRNHLLPGFVESFMKG